MRRSSSPSRGTVLDRMSSRYAAMKVRAQMRSLPRPELPCMTRPLYGSRRFQELGVRVRRLVVGAARFSTGVALLARWSRSSGAVFVLASRLARPLQCPLATARTGMLAVLRYRPLLLGRMALEIWRSEPARQCRRYPFEPRARGQVLTTSLRFC